MKVWYNKMTLAYIAARSGSRSAETHPDKFVTKWSETASMAERDGIARADCLDPAQAPTMPNADDAKCGRVQRGPIRHCF